MPSFNWVVQPAAAAPDCSRMGFSQGVSTRYLERLYPRPWSGHRGRFTEPGCCDVSTLSVTEVNRWQE